MSSKGQGRGGKRSGKKTKGAKKSSLPAFGFAEDLLKGKARPDDTGKDPEPAAAEGGPAEGGPAEGGPAECGPAEGGPAEGGPAESADATAASEPAPKKISLPAFGFAEDLLQSVEGEGQAADAAETAAAETALREEDRIFTFADSLEAQEEEEKAAPVRLETWMTFSLAGETFALPVAPVHEVLRLSSITRVPHAPFPIRGVTNLRGRVVPVIDLRLRLELPEGEVTRSSRIVVVGSRGRRLGLLVDSVHQVVHLEVDRVQPPPDDVMTVQSDYIRGVYHMEDQLILLLDVDRVLIVREPSGASGAAVGAA